jgi:glycosyltransferase involved in cell wall biosynthesis
MSRETPRAAVGLVVFAFDKGGLEQVVLNLYRGYRQKGFDCVVLVEGNSVGYMAERLDDPNDLFVFNGNEIDFIRVCLQRKIEIIHYHYSVFRITEMKLLGFFVIYTIHNIYTWMNDEEFRGRSADIAKSDSVVAVSSFVKDYFIQRAAHLAIQVDVIPNGVVTLELTPKFKITREEMGLPADGFIFVNVASTHRAKHQAALIGAAEILLRSRQDFYVAILGNVSDADYRDEIAAILAASPARGHAGFRPFISVDRLHSMYTEVVDCLLMPSLQEGCANVVLEALAVGCPMILTDVGNAREAARIDESIIVVPRAYSDLSEMTKEGFIELSRTKNTTNVKAIAAAMNRMIDHRPPRPKPAELEARRAAVDARTMVDAYIAIIESRTKPG